MEVGLASFAMATDTSQTGSGGSSGGSSGAAKSAPDEPRYSREELPEFLGVAPHIFAGAVASERNQTFTVAAAQKLVDKFLKHEDESEGAQADPEPEEG